MRDSTGHTAELSAVQAVELFNMMFDRIVPPIETRRGEVLKYLGDGLLAIFRDKGGVAADASREPSGPLKRRSPTWQPSISPVQASGRVDIGIALHYGEAAYGNVGSGLRLDFTVIGRDIGLASRIGTMNAKLGEPLLMSQAFVDRLHRPVHSLGAFAARGFATPLAVFRPA